MDHPRSQQKPVIYSCKTISATIYKKTIPGFLPIRIQNNVVVWSFLSLKILHIWQVLLLYLKVKKNIKNKINI